MEVLERGGVPRSPYLIPRERSIKFILGIALAILIHIVLGPAQAMQSRLGADMPFHCWRKNNPLAPILVTLFTLSNSPWSITTSTFGYG